MARPRRAIGFKGMNAPIPITVQHDEENVPVTIRLKGREHPVESVMDRWEIDDEWWRGQRICRMYYQVVVDGGRVVIVYRDLDGSWYHQNAG